MPHCGSTPHAPSPPLHRFHLQTRLPYQLKRISGLTSGNGRSLTWQNSKLSVKLPPKTPQAVLKLLTSLKHDPRETCWCHKVTNMSSNFYPRPRHPTSKQKNRSGNLAFVKEPHRVSNTAPIILKGSCKQRT